MIYRRRVKSDVWHFVPACHWFPPDDGVPHKDSRKKPTTGELCDECLAKAAAKK